MCRMPPLPCAAATTRTRQPLSDGPLRQITAPMPTSSTQQQAAAEEGAQQEGGKAAAPGASCDQPWLLA